MMPLYKAVVNYYPENIWLVDMVEDSVNGLERNDAIALAWKEHNEERMSTMSDTLNDIKAKLIFARKNREKRQLAFLSLVISECEIIGKNKGGRETTEEEVIRVIEKMIKSLDLIANAGRGNEEAKVEKEFLMQYIPQKVDEETLRVWITENCAGITNIGQAMGAIKKEFGTTADMKLASAIVKDVIQ